MIVSCRRLLHCNTTMEEDEDRLPLSFSSQIKRRKRQQQSYLSPSLQQNKQENDKKIKKREELTTFALSSTLLLEVFAPGSCFYFLLQAFAFASSSLVLW